MPWSAAGTSTPLAQRDAGRAPVQPGLSNGAAAVGLAQQLVDEFLDHGKSLRMRQPRSQGDGFERRAGLVATGSLASSSSGRSLVESL
jgi:hypothetical protein